MAELSVVFDTTSKTFKRITLDGRAVADVMGLRLTKNGAMVWNSQGDEVLPTPSTSAPTAPQSTTAPTAPRATAADGAGDPFLDAAGTLKAVEDVVSFFASPAQAAPSEYRA